MVRHPLSLPQRGSQLSQRESQGRFAPYHVQQNTIHRNTQSTNVAGIYSLPYGGLSKNLPAKLQFAWLLMGIDP